MKTLELKIPPPIVAIFTATAMWLAKDFVPTFDLALSARLIAPGLVLCLAGYFGITGMIAFRRAKTTVNPLKPENSSSLVTSGVYRVTRNPMYVSFALILVAWMVYLSSIALLAGPLLFALYITRFQIQPEERILQGIFGDAFTTYMQQTRRWL
jgi:protein-S-isoprenylcysteine O-methyltransferase Ste14